MYSGIEDQLKLIKRPKLSGLCCQVVFTQLGGKEEYLRGKGGQCYRQKVLREISCVSHKVVIYQTKTHFEAKLVEFLMPFSIDEMVSHGLVQPYWVKYTQSQPQY